MSRPATSPTWTNDEFNNYGPVYSRGGDFILYSTRISGNQKLFRMDLASGQKRQITFGTHDDVAPQFMDDSTIVFASTTRRIGGGSRVQRRSPGS